MKKILIVDDAPLNRKVLAALLKQAGYEPLQAAGATDARERFAQEHPAYVLTDRHMPGEDGVSLAQTLRAAADSEHPFRIALLTGDGADVQVPEGLFDAVFAKPVSLSELKPFLEEA